jgi:hypothetical protein
VSVPTSGLFIAPCSRDAAYTAVVRWHYSGTLPSGRCLYFGVWFDSVFVGVVIVSRGATQHIGSPFGLRQDQIAEVTRIALKPDHVPPVSQVLAIVVRLVTRSNPGLEMLISYADSRHGHDGRGVYGGSGWAYLGQTHREATLWLRGRERHARTVSSRFGTRDLRWLREHVDPQAARIDCPPKHKWALGLTPTMRHRLTSMSRPYPTRPKVAGSDVHPVALAGAMPSRPLHLSEANAHA